MTDTVTTATTGAYIEVQVTATLIATVGCYIELDPIQESSLLRIYGANKTSTKDIKAGGKQ